MPKNSKEPAIMALTRLGWDVLEPGSTRLTNLDWITGKVRNGDAWVILNELGRRFNNEVEKIVRSKSWGYNARDVRGAPGVISEHNAGVAVDFNAPDHWLGLVGTFSSAQVRAIHRILSDLDGVVRWGGDYGGRKDEMHFELQGGVARLKKVADQIRGNVGPVITPPKPKPTPKPKPVKKDAGAHRTYKAGEVASIQKVLDYAGYDVGPADDDYGTRTEDAVKAYQKAQRYPKGAQALKPDGDWGPVVQAHYEWTRRLQNALNQWASVKPKLRLDGDLAKLTTRAVGQIQEANFKSGSWKGAYWKAGGRAVDSEPGPITCKMLGIPSHP